MKKRYLRKTALSLGLALVMLMSSTAVSFAETQSIPMVLNLKEKVLDVSVPDKFTMTAKTKKTDLTITPLVVTNNAAGNSLFLLEVKYGGDVSPWKLVSNSTNFAGLNKNQHKYSLVVEGTDLSEGVKTYSEEIAPKGSYSITMTGKTGLSTEAASTMQAGSLVLTVGFTDPNAVRLIAFTICGLPYTAKEGMTWAEWLESDMNNSPLTITEDGAVLYEDHQIYYMDGGERFQVGNIHEIIEGQRYGYFDGDSFIA